MHTLRHTLLVAALVALAPAFAAGQLCNDNFWKNDSLPDNPMGAITVSVIPGLCEGEAAAQVFQLGGAGPQQIEKVSVGFGSGGGVNGNIAVVNVEIYDGITWNAGVPTLGTKVFDFEDDVGGNIQLTSTGINEFDLSNENIVVGQGTDAFVVAWRMLINFNGTCAAGFSSNFFTDNAGLFGCTTPSQESLIDIAGQGWSDASTVVVSGFPLCPLFFNGSWVIRACTSDVVGGTGQFVNLGNALTGNFAPTLNGSGSLAGGASFTLSFASLPPFTSGIVFLGLTAGNLPFKGGVLVPVPFTQFSLPTVGGTIPLPASMPLGLPSGLSLILQGWFPDAGGPKGASATNGLEMILP